MFNFLSLFFFRKILITFPMILILLFFSFFRNIFISVYFLFLYLPYLPFFFFFFRKILVYFTCFFFKLFFVFLIMFVHHIKIQKNTKEYKVFLIVIYCFYIYTQKKFIKNIFDRLQKISFKM